MTVKRINQFACLFLLAFGFQQKLRAQNTFLREYVTNSTTEDFGVHCSTLDGGFLLAGTEAPRFQSGKKKAVALLKIDSRGKLEKRVNIMNSAGESANHILACRDSGFLYSGYNFISKINSDLQEDWRVNIINSWNSGGYTYYSIELADSGFITSSYVGSNGGGFVRVRRLSKNGKLIWSKGYKIYDQDPNAFWSANYGYEMELDADSNINFIGTLFSSEGSSICLLRIGLNGKRILGKQLTHVKYAKGTFFETAGPNRLVIAGTHRTPNAVNTHHLYLVECDTLGDTIKTRQFKNITIIGRVEGGFQRVANNRFAHCALELYDGTKLRICLSVFNDNLDSLYTKRFEFSGGGLQSLDFSVVDDSFLVASGTLPQASSSDYNFFLLKTKIDGSIDPCGLLQNRLNSNGTIYTQCERDSALLTLFSPKSTPNKIEWFRDGKKIKSGADSTLYVKDTAEYYTVVHTGKCVDTTSSIQGWLAKAYQDTHRVSVCKGDDYRFGGIWRRNQGIYHDSMVSINGCDSVTVLDLEVIQPTYQTFYEKLCPRDTIWFAGVAHAKRGYYRYTLLSSRGCDSNVNIGISPAKTYDTTLTEYICRGSFYQLGAKKLRQKGYYQAKLKSVYGCDSLVKLYLRFKDTNMVYSAATICNGASFNFGSQVISDTGQYVDTFLNKRGCDSVVFLTVHNERLNAKLRPSGDTLIAPSGYAKYSWFNCTDQVLVSETSNRLVVKDDKFYQVTVESHQSCSDTSWCTSRNISVGKNSLKTEMNLFPNPFGSKVLVSTQMKNITNVKVYDMAGKNVFRINSIEPTNNILINTASWKTGVYFFHLTLETGSRSAILVKTQ